MGIHTQANFGKVAKGSNAYFPGLYRGIVGGLRSNPAKWCRDCWAMDEDWPLTRERHVSAVPMKGRCEEVGICDAKHPAPSDLTCRTVRPPRNNVPDDLAEATQQLGSSIVILVKLI